MGARLADGRTLIDLQAAHVALKGCPCPHLRDPTAFRLAASHGADLAAELVAFVTARWPAGTFVRLDDARGRVRSALPGVAESRCAAAHRVLLA